MRWVVSLEACAQEGNILKYNSTMHCDEMNDNYNVLHILI